MTNFNFLLSDPQLTTFGEVAVAAERIYTIDPAACVLNCRRCMEFAVKWMYSVDGGLVMPYDDRLASLMDTEDFRAIVDRDLWQRLKYIRQTGNAAAHTGKKITKEQAQLCLENLWYFMDFIACCYGTTYTAGEFDPALLEQQTAAPAPAPAPEVDLAALMAENEALRAELTARRETQQPSYTPKPLDLSEYKTRKLYIDAMLTDAGWTEGKDWLNEVELPGMPNQSEVGYADYVLYDDAHRPLAVIEAKRTCVDPAKGRQQAKLYADLLEQKYGRRPVIFLTNGFDTRIDDGAYPERRVAAFYSKRDLEKFFNLRVLGDVAGCVSCRTVHLRGVLAREGAAAVGTASAVAIDDDLAARESRISVRAADDELARGIHVQDIVVADQSRQLILGAFQTGLDAWNEDRAHVLADLLLHAFFGHLLGDALARGDEIVVLGRNHDGMYAQRTVRLFVVFDRYLRLGVGTQVGHHLPFAADDGQFLENDVREDERRRHVFARFVARIAEHDALIARALFFFGLAYDTLVDVRRLFVDRGEHAAGITVELIFAFGITDTVDYAACYVLDIDVGARTHFARDDDQTGGAERFAGYFGVGVVTKEFVENGIGNLIRNFVGVSFGHGLRRK